MKRLRLILKITLPLLVVGSGGLATLALINSYEKPTTLQVEIKPPLVRVMPVETSSMTLTVRAEGTVTPRTESQLVPEISGRIVEMSPSLVAGGFFEKGDVLIKIETREYDLALTRAKAAIEQTKLRLFMERQEADIARKEWELLGEGAPSALLVREPQITEIKVTLASAEAALAQTQYDLDRTVIKAPFAGRVRSKQVDVGQFVQRGMTVATLYSVDVAEVRLPIPNSELEYCSLPMAYRNSSEPNSGPAVKLTAEFAGKTHSWQGRIVRTEGEIDPRTRMVNAIAQVQDPYALLRNSQRPPLAVGMFVHAEIQGNRVHGVVKVPRNVMHSDTQILIVDSANRLYSREVDVLRMERDFALIQGGLQEGDRVCISNLETFINGMRVSVEETINPVAQISTSGSRK